MVDCLHPALVSSQKGVAVWTFVFHLVQIVNAAWDTGTTPKSENQKKNEIQAYFIEFDIFHYSHNTIYQFLVQLLTQRNTGFRRLSRLKNSKI